jgi:hypothetical protein
MYTQLPVLLIDQMGMGDGGGWGWGEQMIMSAIHNIIQF